MPDAQGIPLVLLPGVGGGPFPRPPRWVTPRTGEKPTHAAFKLDAEAVAARREELTLAIAIGMDQRGDPRDAADAVQRVLGIA